NPELPSAARTIYEATPPGTGIDWMRLGVARHVDPRSSTRRSPPTRTRPDRSTPRRDHARCRWPLGDARRRRGPVAGTAADCVRRARRVRHRGSTHRPVLAVLRAHAVAPRGRSRPTTVATRVAPYTRAWTRSAMPALARRPPRTRSASSAGG